MPAGMSTIMDKWDTSNKWDTSLFTQYEFNGTCPIYFLNGRVPFFGHFLGVDTRGGII